MAVLVEAISVIVRRDAVEKNFRDGWPAFLRHVPNGTLCYDRNLARVGFMSPQDVRAYVSILEAGGLVFHEGGQAVDFVVVDQYSGPTVPTSWLEIGKIENSEMKIIACWLAGQPHKEVSLPEGWQYEDSLSAKSGFTSNKTMDSSLKFLRREDGINGGNGTDVYLDLRTGKEKYVARMSIEGETEPAIFTRLQTICHEGLKIEAKMQALQDEQELARLFNRLNDELLPTVEQIAEGGGRQMAFAHFASGLILRILHRPEEAERSFRKSNKLQPAIINTLLELVRCLGEQNKDSDALPFAREAVGLSPEDSGAWGNLAMCLIQCGERDEARKAIDYAIALDPQDPMNCYIRDNFEGYFKKR